MDLKTRQKLERLAADRSSPYEAEIAQRRLDRLNERKRLPVPSLPKRPAKWLLALLIGVASKNDCTLIKQNNVINIDGKATDIEAALESFKTHRNTLQSEVARLHRKTPQKVAKWRSNYLQNRL